MKIIVCGIHPAKARAVERKFPEHDVRVVDSSESPKRYAAHVRDCDLCIVNWKHITHNKVEVIRQFIPRSRIAYAAGDSACIEAVANATKQREAA